jgi:hypothetical protein
MTWYGFVTRWRLFKPKLYWIREYFLPGLFTLLLWGAVGINAWEKNYPAAIFWLLLALATRQES